ncbi:uncharacterized protein B0H64DRAFT_36797 [Chaetomium fimeti]|uniref:Uncharacterized protein n=1 Tax=Chaetomium fimeti TaxID=1854472 RepID=A0AAE0HRJ1_9PEZI|nr:hypothetical protein B0H64DRAFT_36797 [Chaetomium fimeti]
MNVSRARHFQTPLPSPFISRNHLRKRDFFRTHHLHSLGFGGVVSSDALAYLRSSWLPGTGSRQGQPTARPAQATRWLGRLSTDLLRRIVFRFVSFPELSQTDKLVFAPSLPRHCQENQRCLREPWYTAAQGPTAVPWTRRTTGSSCCAFLNCRAGSEPGGEEPAERTWLKGRRTRRERARRVVSLGSMPSHVRFPGPQPCHASASGITRCGALSLKPHGPPRSATTSREKRDPALPSIGRFAPTDRSLGLPDTSTTICRRWLTTSATILARSSQQTAAAQKTDHEEPGLPDEPAWPERHKKPTVPQK